jgi:NADP-dependent alcohol dehydrogenase
MTVFWTAGRRPTQVMYGIAGLGEWVRSRRERRVTLLLDPGVADAPVAARVRQSLDWAGASVDTVGPAGPGDPAGITELAGRLAGTELLVAVGGGSVLDQAKLAALLAAEPAQLARLTARSRAGLVLLPATVDPALPLVAVPTTIGTGSELSSVACLTRGDGKRLVVGTGLQPEIAVLDPLATRTLPDGLLAEGALEILFRAAGGYVGDHQDLPLDDALARTLIGRVVRLGARLREARRAGQRLDGALRLELARISGLTHTPLIGLTRDPCACKGWYLANEFSTGLGLRKMTAAAALLPPLWEAVLAPDARWGSARRLTELWRTIQDADPELHGLDPVRGVAALIDSWQVERRITAAPGRLEAIARAAELAWGRGQPMLAGLDHRDLRDLLDRSVTAALPSAA